MNFVLILTLIVFESGPVNVTTVEIATVDFSTEQRCERAAVKWLHEIPPPTHRSQKITKSALCVEK